MTTLSRREQNKIETRARILKSALHEFSKSGYAGASMDLIAQSAGISKPTLYQYYENKDALFKAMMEAPREELMLAFSNDPQLSMVEKLLNFAWAYANTVMRPELLSLARLVIGEAHRFPGLGRRYQAAGPDKVLAALMVFMCEQRSQGCLQFRDAELVAQDFWGLILSAPRNKALHEPDVNISHQELARYIHNGIAVFLSAYSCNLTQDLKILRAATRQSNSVNKHA